MTDLDVTTPIDLKKGIEVLGGDQESYYEMLGSLEEMSVIDCMKRMVKEYDAKNYPEIKAQAHSLKGASSYIGASRLHYMCYFIQHHFVKQEFPEMLVYYPSLVEAAIEFKKESRKLIAENSGK